MYISHVIKKIDTCHFYRLVWKRFLQPSLEENSVLIINAFSNKKHKRQIPKSQLKTKWRISYFLTPKD
jgi:hypothetical protein